MTRTTLPPAPRTVHRKFGSGCALWFPRLFILPHFLAGIGMLVAVPLRLYVYHDGTPVKAVIHSLQKRNSKKGGDYYVIGFHYFLGGHQYNEENESLTADEGARTKIGDTFDGRAATILMMPWFLRADLDIKRDAITLGGIALVWNTFVGIAMYMLWVVPTRQRWLLRRGEETKGAILGRTVTARARGTTYHVLYKFTTADGEPIKTGCDVSKEACESANPGDPVTVIYNPRNPKRSLPYELCDFSVTND